MRDIKFRAWDKKKKKWIDGAYGFHILGEMMLIGGLFQDYSIENLNDIVIEQFTGLFDKSGKEIYEGDIIQDVYCHNYEKWVVTWWPEMAQFVLTNGSSDVEKAAKEELVMKENDRIIGNIHQNPELLEQDR